jgi:hypothetical protein
MSRSIGKVCFSGLLLAISGFSSAGANIPKAGADELQMHVRSRPGGCASCKDFSVGFSRRLELNAADKANGLSERWLVGLEYLYQQGEGWVGNRECYYLFGSKSSPAWRVGHIDPYRESSVPHEFYECQAWRGR